MREKWYVVTHKQPLNSTLGAITGIRMAEKNAFPGTIIPGAWFDMVNDDDFHNLLIDGYGAVTPYEPSADELPLLYTLFPATRPKSGLKVATNGGLVLKNKWYRVSEHVAMLYGIAALVKVDGVCAAGEVAFGGDIIPSHWLAGLSIEQINVLERDTVYSQEWLNAQSREFRAKFMRSNKPQLLRISPSPMELKNLYKRFPGADPKAAVADVAPAEDSEDGE